jgi:hypothetical protein
VDDYVLFTVVLTLELIKEFEAKAQLVLTASLCHEALSKNLFISYSIKPPYNSLDLAIIQHQRFFRFSNINVFIETPTTRQTNQ